MEKGVRYVLLTALISGISIFVNNYGVKGVDATVYTLLKNTVAVLFLVAAISIFMSWKEYSSLTKQTWGKLLVIGLVGGSIPFVLFFKGLQMSSALPGSFIHKTLFIWVGVMALLFLKEKLSKTYMVSAGLILSGLLVLFWKQLVLGWNLGSTLILLATLFWAGENVISKHVLSTTSLSGKNVALARMGFGAMFILAYLLFTSQLPYAVSSSMMLWSLITGGFLFLFLITWYSGIKLMSVSKASAILTLGAVITPLLMLAFKGVAISSLDALGFLLIAVGAISVAFLEGWKLPTPSHS